MENGINFFDFQPSKLKTPPSPSKIFFHLLPIKTDKWYFESEHFHAKSHFTCTSYKLCR